MRVSGSASLVSVVFGVGVEHEGDVLLCRDMLICLVVAFTSLHTKTEVQTPVVGNQLRLECTGHDPRQEPFKHPQLPHPKRGSLLL